MSLIVAVGRNGVIGRNGGLPWRLSSDLKTFRRLTMGKPLVMGRKTWGSLRGPLDGRDNIVVTRDPAFAAAGALVAASVPAALAIARRCAENRGAEEIMVIGGAAIFREVMPLAQRLYWTAVDAEPEGDVVFPDFDRSAWQVVSREALPRGEKDDHAATLELLERTQATGQHEG